ncbi:MAG: hypothetical protein ABIH50_01040 [bacterium]
MRSRILIVALVLVSFSAAALAKMPPGRFGFGLQGLTITTGAATMPTLQFYLNDKVKEEIGVSYATRTPSGGVSINTGTVALALKVMLEPIDNIIPHWGIGLQYTSNPALVSGAGLLAVSLNFGAEVFIYPNLSIEGNISPLTYSSFSAAGVTNNTISVFDSSIVPAVVFGMHYYL